MQNKSAPIKRTLWWHSLRYLVMIFLIVGIVTAALDKAFGGFEPIMWFVLSLITLLIAICNEVLRIADFITENK